MNDSAAHAAKANQDMPKLYREVRKIMAKACLDYGVTDPCLIDHAVSIHFEEHVLRGKAVRHYYPICKLNAKTAIFGRRWGVHSNDRLFRVHCAQFDTRLDYVAPGKPEKEDARDFLKDLLSEHEEGGRIVYKLLTGRVYKRAILEIEKITGRRWIYDRAEKLHYVWRMLHK